MARDPRKEGKSKKRGKKSASGRSRASGSARTNARKSPARVAKPKRRSSSPPASTLARELNDARARQAATAEILKIIAASPDDVQPVFEAIASSANRLLSGHSTGVVRIVDGVLHLAAFTPVNPQADAVLTSTFPSPTTTMPFFEQLARGEPYQEPDMETIPFEQPRLLARARGYRSILFVPLTNAGELIGLINVTRAAPGTFAAEEVQLLQTFANQAVIAIENARLFNETKEALERQTATSEVLQVISSSPGDLKPVFDQMLAKAMRLCEAQCGFIYQGEQGAMQAVAEIGVPRAFSEYRRQNLHTGGAATPIDVMRATRKPAHVHDARDSEPYRSGNPNAVAGVDLGGARTVLYVPMIRNGDIVGVINLYRQEVRPFADEQIALLENFANQALIAIENARLFNETKEALERQTATADILKVIASSPDDVQPVFEAIAERANRLVGGHATSVVRIVGDVLELAAHTHLSDEVDATLRAAFPIPITGLPQYEMMLRGEVAEIGDIEAEANVDYSRLRNIARAAGFRGRLMVPLKTDTGTIGAIAVTRVEPGAFAHHHIQLLKTFADQAVIAIQNVRLFNETKEALARQTATADVLKVIASSPSNLQPVFDAIAERSKELIGGHSTTVFRFAGDMVELVAATSVNAEADAVLRAGFPRPIPAMQGLERTFRGEMVETVDAAADTEFESSRNIARARGFRSRLVVPLESDDDVIGAISITRKEPGAFAAKDVELLRTFADQAVIAIKNVELFEEVQARTRDLEESLQQQTATADVLKVISRSAFDLDAVMNTLASSARDLCASETASLFLREGDMLVCRGNAAVQKEHEEFIRANPVPLNDESHMGRAVLTGTIVNIADFENDPHTKLRKFQQTMGFKAFLAVPLMREGRGVGAIVMGRLQVGEFTRRHVELIQTFADQAVIAIENTRLFNETREALARQTATADVLKVIASSPSNLQPVFDAIAERSKALIGAHSTTVVRYIGGMMELASFTPVSPEADAALRAMFPMRPTSGDPQTEQILRGEIARIADAGVRAAKSGNARNGAGARLAQSAIGTAQGRYRRHRLDQYRAQGDRPVCRQGCGTAADVR